MPIIAAAPYPYEFPEHGLALIVIDMQRDFLEPGGFGEVLGNNVAPLAAIVPTTQRLLDGFRAHGLPIIHTKEAHRPDLADCPPAKRQRGNPTLRIGDPGPMGRILIAGEPGNDIVPALAPLPGESVLAKPGKGAFYRTHLRELLTAMGITHLIIAGVTTEVCVQTTMREANDRGYECLLVEDATASYFPAFKQATLEDDPCPGGDCRLDCYSRRCTTGSSYYPGLTTFVVSFAQHPGCRLCGRLALVSGRLLQPWAVSYTFPC